MAILPKEMMETIEVLLSPVFFGAACLLLGEGFHRLALLREKKRTASPKDQVQRESKAA